ncbi:acyltransferase [Mucilaginibacter sp. RS28]|uniref:Acyltransferase n=1 Tax=Mucilaginibacter straminoryzae TaxID=2932774 RepID=A0A9X1WZY1_9SPHI|nr:acyltransferase [Mucilaginibacter straminoryzae]MCJ8208241.1 acyltransferase [Mucilaginibacter straminoryzae]
MQKTSSAYIPSLDGLRGLSILLVYIAHVGYEKLVPGGLGVTVFFFISGYIITNLLLDEYEKTGTTDLKLFYSRRMLRLYPPLLLMLGLYLVASVFVLKPANPSEVFAALFYYENYYFFFHSLSNHSSLMILWSLAVEEHFYLLFPLLFMLLVRNVQQLKITLAILIVIPLALRFWSVMVYQGQPDLAEANTYLLTHNRFDSILYGCLASVIQYSSSSKSYEKVLSNKLVFIVALAVQLLCLVVRDATFRNTLRYSLQGLSLFILVPAIVNINAYHWLKEIFSNKALVFIGKLSYSIYLMHMLAVNALMPIKTAGHTILYILAVTGVTLTLSLSSYYLVEKPLGKLRKRLKPKPLPIVAIPEI